LRSEDYRIHRQAEAVKIIKAIRRWIDNQIFKMLDYWMNPPTDNKKDQ
jgi:hypothetical protein